MPIRPENRVRYPANWPDLSLSIRRDRAEWQCECDGRCGPRCSAELIRSSVTAARCLARQGQPHPRTGSRVVLTVAHLDHQPENCDDGNLLAMCQACHLTYDRDHHAETARATRAAAAGLEPQFEVTP